MMLANIFQDWEIIMNPLLVGILISITAALLGVVLVLKRFSMIGDGLSHVSFGVFAITLSIELVNPNLAIYIVIPIVMVVAYILLRIGESTKIRGDAAIGLISSAFLAIGYFVGSRSGFTTDINSYMFGSITLADKSDLIKMLPVTILVIVIFIFLYNRIFAITFDEQFAKATGIKTRIYNMIFAFFTAIVVVIGIRIMGTLLISSLIILPALSAMQITNRFKWVLVTSVAISVFSFLIAFIFLMEVPSAAGIVMVNLGVFLVSVIIGIFKKKIV